MTDIIVAVMGATGTGKSTFINLASGSQFEVGSGLRSSTTEVRSTQPFDMNGRKMVLIDTPGFDDTTRTDTEILRTIATYLAKTYREDKRLSGIIYMHRISDYKMSGISRRNFGMFRKLCGDETLGSVVLATNMWGTVAEHIAVTRENELKSDNVLFKPVLDKGAKMMRHYNTLDSAQAILQTFADKHPVMLQIQQEVVAEGRDITQTAAGAELEAEKNRELEEAKRKQAEELRRTQEALRAKMAEEERRQRAAIEEARRKAEQDAARAREAHKREMARQAEQRRQEEERQREIQREIQRQIEAEANARRAQEAEAQRIQQELVQQQQAAAAAQQRLREEIERVQWHHHQGGGGGGGGCIIC